MTIYVSRTEWGAARPKKRVQQLVKREQRGLAVHHSGSAGDQRERHSECATVVRAIQRHHQATKGWNDLAYSWLACAHEHLFEGRGPGVRTASQGTDAGNDGWHSVCWLGDGDGFDGSTAAAAPLLTARSKTLQHSLTASLVWPHLRFHPTACPGGRLREWCRQFPD